MVAAVVAHWLSPGQKVWQSGCILGAVTVMSALGQHLTLLGHMAPVATEQAVLDLLGHLAGLCCNRLVMQSI